jgi:signal transduction histidine kinase
MCRPDDRHQELESRVAELEAEKAALQTALQQVERERVEYLQNISHQLVAPLNAIKWHIENLTEARVGVERARKVLRSVYSQATIAVHLAKNFNLMSNLEADHALSKLKEPLQKVELLRLLINIADDFQPMAWDRNISIGVDENCFDDEPPVLAMKPLISQVFSNIIENAVKYSESGSNIRISGKHNPAKETFSVQVANRGIALPDEERARVFDRGFRGTQAVNKYPAGTGFGLYIARRIVEIHEGQIAARSEGGVTVFEVTLSVRGLEGKARYLEREDRPTR